MSAFLHFCAEQREAVKAEHPEITGKAGEITKILGQRWKALDGDAKARYNEMAAADKRRYDAEKKERGGDSMAGGTALLLSLSRCNSGNIRSILICKVRTHVHHASYVDVLRSACASVCASVCGTGTALC